MKEIVIVLIRWYQVFISLPLRILTGATFTCKFSLTCSEYAAQAIEDYGVIRGGFRAIRRLLSCQPFARYYDRTI